MGLAQLQPDRPATDHDQMAGQRAVGEDRLVGEEARLVDSDNEDWETIRAATEGSAIGNRSLRCVDTVTRES